MRQETGYAKLLRCVLSLWRTRTEQIDTTYKRYCIDYITDYVSQAELAWRPTELTGPRSISGSHHLMEHLAHDLGLTERDEVTFRMWWNRAMDYGFERKAA